MFPRALISLFALLFVLAASAPPVGADERPNVLWITSEDNGPQLGAYGDEYADTPELDALAARGLTYVNVWSNAPVCAPARTAIISGLLPTSTGAQHMRCMTRLPEGARMFPELLREAGYYCTNRSKEDYNLEQPVELWDASSGKAHWRGRAADQPFFAVFNITLTHESRIRKRPHEAVHDPDLVRVPAYHPDHPEVRRDWAQYHDKMSEMDARAGAILAELAEDGLADDTIVFYFGDHGPGMPRGKRTACDAGLHVPLIVSIPARFRELAPEDYEVGGSSARLVSFVDLAPTVLSLAGIHALGPTHGRAFCGAFEEPAPDVLFGFRDRMDERYDLVRAVRDARYVYIRNYLPHLIPGQHVDYLFQTPTTRIWHELYERGELEPPRTAFWQPKPPEELYDLAADPDEVHNLAGSPEHADVLARLRAAQRALVLETRDLGFLPEAELRRRAGDEPPYALGQDAERYPLAGILAAAERASSGEAETAELIAGLDDTDGAVRYWSAVGLLTRDEPAARAPLRAHLEDPCPSARVAAAEALARHGGEADLAAALAVLVDAADLREQPLELTLAALNALDALDERALAVADELRALPRESDAVSKRMASYVPRLFDALLADLEPAPGPRELVYKRVGEHELRLFVHEPPGPAPAEGRPAVVFFHGGGWTGGDPAQFFDQCAHLAARGVVGISAEYRLGKKHGASPFDCVADGKSAVRWVRAHAAELGIDPHRIGAGGGSAGGHVAAAVAAVPGLDDEPDAQTSCRPDLLLLFNPVFDNGPDGWGHARVGERYLEISPLHNLHAAMPPTLVLLGTADALVPVETARRYEQRARELGAVCELVLYDGAAHGFFNRGRSEEHYEQTMAEVDAFLDELGLVSAEQAHFRRVDVYSSIWSTESGTFFHDSRQPSLDRSVQKTPMPRARRIVQRSGAERTIACYLGSFGWTRTTLMEWPIWLSSRRCMAGSSPTARRRSRESCKKGPDSVPVSGMRGPAEPAGDPDQ